MIISWVHDCDRLSALFEKLINQIEVAKLNTKIKLTCEAYVISMKITPSISFHLLLLRGIYLQVTYEQFSRTELDSHEKSSVAFFTAKF